MTANTKVLRIMMIFMWMLIQGRPMQMGGLPVTPILTTNILLGIVYLILKIIDSAVLKIPCGITYIIHLIPDFFSYDCNKILGHDQLPFLYFRTVNRSDSTHYIISYICIYYIRYFFSLFQAIFHVSTPL